MSQIEELADRVDRLLLRHGELQRTNALLLEQVALIAQERDNLRLRLNAARHRIDVLLERLPQDPSAEVPHERLVVPGVDGAAAPLRQSSASSTSADAPITLRSGRSAT